jgi:hypothetical protein
MGAERKIGPPLNDRRLRRSVESCITQFYGAGASEGVAGIFLLCAIRRDAGKASAERP